MQLALVNLANHRLDPRRQLLQGASRVQVGVGDARLEFGRVLAGAHPLKLIDRHAIASDHAGALLRVVTTDRQEKSARCAQ